MNSTTDNWVRDEETIELGALIAILWRHRWWIVASGVICTIIAVLIAVMSTPIFRATVVLVPANNEASGGLDAALGQLGGLASLAGLNVGGGRMEKEEALAVLRSREFTEAFIRDKQLMPVLFAAKWDDKKQSWLPDTKPPTPAQAYKYFHQRVRTILQDKKTNLVSVQIEWQDGALAADWANELVRRLNAEMRGRAITHADASVGYLEHELESTAVVATRESINRLIESQIKQRMLANVTQEYAFRVVDRAMAPDADDPVWPNKPLVVIVGGLAGGVLGIAGVIFATLVRRRVA